MIDTAGTLCAGGQALMEHGATRVFACATHAVFSGRRWRTRGQRVRAGCGHRHDPGQPGRAAGQVQVLSVAPILADTISNVFNDDSVSGLFHGGNQLF